MDVDFAVVGVTPPKFFGKSFTSGLFLPHLESKERASSPWTLLFPRQPGNENALSDKGSSSEGLALRPRRLLTLGNGFFLDVHLWAGLQNVRWWEERQETHCFEEGPYILRRDRKVVLGGD